MTTASPIGPEVIHIVARTRTATCALRSMPAAPPVWHHGHGAPAASPESLIVVDLPDLPADITAQAVLPPACRCPVIVVIGAEKVHPSWLQALVTDRIEVVTCNAGCSGIHACAPLVASLSRTLSGCLPLLVPEKVIGADRLLAEFPDAVAVLCRHPWTVRKPRDLALALNVGRRRLKRRALSLGCARIEHLRVRIRLAILTSLAPMQRLRALGTAGIDDASNFRRQLERARRGSPQLFTACGGLALTTSGSKPDPPAWPELREHTSPPRQ